MGALAGTTAALALAGGAALALAGTTAATVATVATAVAVAPGGVVLHLTTAATVATAVAGAPGGVVLHLLILEVLIPRTWAGVLIPMAKAGTTTIGGLGNTPIWTSTSLGAGFATETMTAPTAPMKSTATAALALAITKTIYNTYDDTGYGARTLSTEEDTAT